MNDPRTAYLLQILEKIGTPLMTAITESSAGSDAQSEAQLMASLLGRTVQTSIDLAHAVEAAPGQSIDDSVRVALAGLASPLVAGQFKKKGQLPDDASLKKITFALQAVMTFSENFAPTGENAARLKDLESKGQPADAAQTQVQYLQAFLPVVEAIAAFPFGQPEQKLLTEVSARLVSKAAELRETLLPGVTDDGAQKRAELGLLRTLCHIYSSCHSAETDKAMKSSDQARLAGLSIDSVWASFSLRAAMLETLASHMLPLAGAGGGAGKAPAVSPPLAAPPAAPAAPPPQAAPPIFQAPPTQSAPAQSPPPIFQAPPAAPPPAAAPPAQSAPASAANPLSFFSKGPAEAAQNPVTPPASSPPPAAAIPPAPPPAPPPSSGTQESGESSTGGGAGPMSFFKKSE